MLQNNAIIHQNMTELLHNQFEPINRKGLNAILNGGDNLIWEYKDRYEDLVVGRPPGYPDQVFIGPEKCVRSLAIAFNILDSFALAGLRAMSALIIKNYYGDEKPIDPGLLARFGVLDKFEDKTYALERVKNVGVTPELRSPVARLIDYYDYYQLTDLSAQVGILYASSLKHEWTHVEQKRLGLPVNSLWSERSAMTSEARFLFSLLNNGKLKKFDEDYISRVLQYLSDRIDNYRNGRGFSDHLTQTGSNSDGTPLRKQNLHTEDFTFGY
jgi:hypothetical protein